MSGLGIFLTNSQRVSIKQKTQSPAELRCVSSMLHLESSSEKEVDSHCKPLVR